MSYRLFDLAFVRLNLLLEFVDGVLVLIVRLTFFLSLHRQFAQSSLLLPHRLLRLLVAMLLRLHLHFQFPYAVLQLLNDLAASLHGTRLGLVQTSLKLFHLQI